MGKRRSEGNEAWIRKYRINPSLRRGRERPWRRFAPGIWWCGVAFPFAVIFIAGIFEKLFGITVVFPRWAFFSLFAIAIVVTTTGCFLSDLSLLAKIAMAVFTVILFPCFFVVFAFLVILIFGFEAT